ncbi:hypothetical protein GGR51DRAFT_531948 [Nemania sp. FL0031]|nr:hypothetical protein GGR51DRAFT_531948 [Nemania sp. FL0031]
MARPSVCGQASAISPVQTGMRPLKIRSACNRCHQQKLRCIKAKGRTSCERCAKHQTECRYSPRRRHTSRHRPLENGPGALPEPRDLAPARASVIADMQRDATAVPGSSESSWPPFTSIVISDAGEPGHPNSNLISLLQLDLAGLIPTDPYQICQPLGAYALDYDGDGAALHTIPIDQDAIGDEVGNYSLSLPTPDQVINGHNHGLGNGLGSSLACVAGRLAGLNVALYECASKLPSIKPSRTGAVGLDNDRAMNGHARKEALLAIDEVFHVTNEFIDVMKNLIPTNEIQTLTTTVTPDILNSCHFASEINTAAPLPETSPRASREPILESEISSSPIDPSSHLDEATLLLFLSCHYRLTTIYESIFQAMQRCIAGSHAATHSAAGIILPQLQVGGIGGVSSPALRVDFNGPRLPSTTITMYMVLIATLSAQLWAQVGETLKRGRGCYSSGDQASPANVMITDPTWDVAVRRTDDVSRIITVVQHSL